MDDFFQKVTSMQDPFKKLLSFIPGFGGYIERQNRRDADKLLRDTVAQRFEEQHKRTSQLQTELVSAGKIEFVDDMEKAAIKLQTFIDKISRAPRGSTRKNSKRSTNSTPRSSTLPNRSGARSITWSNPSATTPRFPPRSATSPPPRGWLWKHTKNAPKL
mgnify:CR=1 FL=1